MNEQFSLKFKQFLLILKKRYKITSKQIASEMGISVNTITNWKKGRSKIHVKPLCNFLCYLQDFNYFQENIVRKDAELREIVFVLQNHIESVLSKRGTFSHIDSELIGERKYKFCINFSIFIDYLNEKAQNYILDYDNIQGSKRRLVDYQHREIFDNLIVLGLISRNQNRRYSVQKNLANILGVSEAQISRWKKGLDYPTNENHNKIANLFGKVEDPLYLYSPGSINFDSYFLKSPRLVMEINEFKEKYFTTLKKFLKVLGFNKKLNQIIRDDGYLILYKNEELDLSLRLLFRDCILLLKKVYNCFNKGNDFIPWLFNEIKREEIKAIEKFFTRFEQNNVGKLYDYAEMIDYGYQDLFDFTYNEGNAKYLGDILESTSLLAIASTFINQYDMDEISFKLWLRDIEKTMRPKEVVRNQTRNYFSNLISLNEDNSEKYVKRFYQQFWSLSTFQTMQPSKDCFSTDSIYLKLGEEGLFKSLEIDYKLLKSVLEEALNEHHLKEESFTIVSMSRYLQNGLSVFEEVLFNLSVYSFERNSREKDFDIISTLEGLHEVVSVFEEEYNWLL